MQELITVDKVCELCKIKKKTAYKLMQEINKELKEEGYLIVRGRVNEKRLKERLGLS